MTVCEQPTWHVDQEVRHAAMARMFDLGSILELVNDGLDNGTLAEQKLIIFNHITDPIWGHQLTHKVSLKVIHKPIS
jgi:hypothetical protein